VSECECAPRLDEMEKRLAKLEGKPPATDNSGTTGAVTQVAAELYSPYRHSFGFGPSQVKS
jgi:hypothetical protein